MVEQKKIDKKKKRSILLYLFGLAEPFQNSVLAMIMSTFIVLISSILVKINTKISFFTSILFTAIPHIILFWVLPKNIGIYFTSITITFGYIIFDEPNLLYIIGLLVEFTAINSLIGIQIVKYWRKFELNKFIRLV